MELAAPDRFQPLDNQFEIMFYHHRGGGRGWKIKKKKEEKAKLKRFIALQWVFRCGDSKKHENCFLNSTELRKSNKFPEVPGLVVIGLS